LATPTQQQTPETLTHHKDTNMRQQDYKMVQGVNQIVNMNPNIAASGGNAMARLGQQLAKTGQDISGMMMETVETQERVDLMRAKQKWQEIESKQLAFQDANKGDPLSWDEHRSKLMDEFHSYNNKVPRRTKNGKLNFMMSAEGFAGDLENSTFRGMQKRINMNLVEEGGIAIEHALETGNPEAAESIANDISSHLTPAAKEEINKRIRNGREKIELGIKMDWIDEDAKESYDDIANRTGIFANIDRETREKLLGYQSRMQQRGIGQQMDDYEVASSDPNYTRMDFDKDVENNKFNQLADGDLAKLTASWDRSAPLTNAEILRANTILAEVLDNKEEMSEEEFLMDFNSKNIELKSLIGISKDYGWMKSAMYDRNPYRKTGGTNNLLKQNKTDNINQVLSLLDYEMKTGNMTPQDGTRGGWVGDVFKPAGMTEKEKHEAGMKQDEIMRAARKHFNKQTTELTSKDVNEWYRKEFKGSKAADEYKRKSSVAPLPLRTQKPNRFRTRDKSFKGQSFQEMDNSTGAVDFIKSFEGFNEKAYDDYGQKSIGYGTRAKKGETMITPEEADARLASELAVHRKRVIDHAEKHNMELTPNQIDALTSFDYNTGAINKLTDGGKRSKEQIAEMILKYTKAGGKELAGLVRRRKAERNLFLT